MMITLGTTRKLVYVACLLAAVGVVSSGLRFSCFRRKKELSLKGTSRISERTEAPTDKYTKLATLEDRNTKKPFCGGAIITRRIVLTAYECPHLPPNATLVRVGVPGAGKEYSVEEVMYFQKEPNYLSNALVITKKRMEFDENVGRVCLPSWNRLLEDEKVVALEWRGTTDNGSATEVLDELHLVIVAERYWNCPDLLLCRGDNGTDPKDDFGGGPLLWWNPKKKRYNLLGISPSIPDDMKESYYKQGPSEGFSPYYVWRDIAFERLYIDVFYYIGEMYYFLKRNYPKERYCMEE